jgi:hypothetical protein
MYKIRICNFYVFSFRYDLCIQYEKIKGEISIFLSCRLLCMYRERNWKKFGLECTFSGAELVWRRVVTPWSGPDLAQGHVYRWRIVRYVRTDLQDQHFRVCVSSIFLGLIRKMQYCRTYMSLEWDIGTLRGRWILNVGSLIVIEVEVLRCASWHERHPTEYSAGTIDIIILLWMSLAMVFCNCFLSFGFYLSSVLKVLKKKKESKAVPLHAMKAPGGRG